ncbi:hypothetical protein QTP86_017197 [Hemibagrus guttatus]|nr:hypothetical protein QTP86_017197 [Hemibagrus guttatus]
MVIVDPSATLCERLTRRHGVCIVCAASVEDCCLAVGNVVGHENIVSASKMNSAIVVFLNDVDKVRKLTQNGIVINNEMILVSPLSSPAKKLMLSNVPPFISDEAIGKELSRYGRLVSPIKKIPLGCKSPLVKHLVSFRRMVFMVFKGGVGELNVVFKFTVEGFDYNIFVSSDTDIKCFKCGQTGHLTRACPERQRDPGVSERPGQDTAEPAGVVPPAAAVRPAAKGPGAAAAPDLTESEPQAQPAAQTPTGATSAPEKPRTAEPAAAEPRSARPDRKKPWSTEKSSVGSGAVLEPPALTEAGAEVQGNRMETPDTTPVQGDGGDVDMVDEPVFKVQNKRKKQEAGDLLSESTEIRKQTVSFYSKLYSSEWSGAQVVEDSFLVGLPKLSERAARELDGELSLEELHEALQRMENGRVSGIDGLPAEFYKAFWAVIGQDVLDVLRDSIQRGELPLSCRRAVLTLLPKKGDLTHLKNWRPVSLLCTDCKLLSKALASRLTKGEGSVEHMKGRLSRWKRLVLKRSYRGRTLVINNLAASSLWHKLACVDPPPNLLANIQAQLVDFFWDGLHWIPQSVLHLLKEEGGQGLVQLSSRAAAFRLQFIQRLLTGPRDLVWRAAASGLLRTVKGLGLDRALFLMDTKCWTFLDYQCFTVDFLRSGMFLKNKTKAVEQYTGCWRSLWYMAGDWTSPV